MVHERTWLYGLAGVRTLWFRMNQWDIGAVTVTFFENRDSVKMTVHQLSE